MAQQLRRQTHQVEKVVAGGTEVGGVLRNDKKVVGFPDLIL